MNRAALEHVLRAAAAITGLDEFIVVGSQSILGQYPSAPESLLVSDEVDLYPVADPEMGELVEGAIGEGSPFHEPLWLLRADRGRAHLGLTSGLEVAPGSSAECKYR